MVPSALFGVKITECVESGHCPGTGKLQYAL